MATHKVIQDIEAEDKFVGPLTLKQFIFACGGLIFGYLNFLAIIKSTWFLLIVFVPPMLTGFFLAIPWTREQPTEVWVLAKLKFYLKPKKKIWDQSGIQQLVTITAPKKPEKNTSKDYTEREVKGKLKALAETIDSRGWAIKHSTQQGSQLAGEELASDRLVSPSSLTTQAPPSSEAEVVPDILDPAGSPRSGDLNQLIQTKDSSRRQQLMKNMEAARKGELPQDQQQNISLSKADDDLDEQLLAKELQEKQTRGKMAYEHMKDVKKPAGKKPQAAMTSTPSPDIIRLAGNDDLNVATIAREANKPEDQDKEVVVPLR